MNYVLIDLERSILSSVVTYWKPNKRGYTIKLDEAGLYSEKEATAIVDGDFNKRTVKVSVDLIENL